VLNPLPLTSALAGRNRLLRGTQGDAALCPGLVSLALSAHNQCHNVKRKCFSVRSAAGIVAAAASPYSTAIRRRALAANCANPATMVGGPLQRTALRLRSDLLVNSGSP